MTRNSVVSLAILLVLALPGSASAAVNVGTSGWFWSDPQPFGNNLRDLEFVGQRGYAVGEAGAILRTDDGGLNWRGLPSGGPDVRGEDLSQVDAVTPDTVVVPTRAECTLRRSDDGGRTFRRMRLVPRRTRCPGGAFAFSFPTPGTGYVALTSGLVLRTVDGGASFSRRTPVPSTPASGAGQATIHRLLFTSPQTGFALSADGTGGRIHRTVDGGASWVQVGSSPAGVLYDIDFADEHTGYAVGVNKAALKTVNGGMSWSPVPLAGAPDQQLTKIACGTPQVCLTASYDQTLRTADGGLTATKVAPLGGAAGGLEFASPTRAVSLGRRGSPAISDDGGVSFRFLGHKLPEGLARARASSRSLAVAFGSAGQLALTQDSGRNWRFIGVPTVRAPHDASFPATSTGYVLERDGTILRTRNGGGDWQEGAKVRGSALLATSANTVLVGGPGGVSRSTDGAARFRRTRSRAGRRAVTKLDSAGSAVFTSAKGSIARSTNGGRTWRAIRRPTRRAILDADFVSARVGYVIAEGPGKTGARLYRTASAGRRWSWIRTVGTPKLYGVTFGGPRAGFVDVGDGVGRLLRTTDGGRTWRPQLIPGDAVNVGGLVAMGANTGIAIAYSSIFATASGGDAPAASSLTLRPNKRRLRRAGSVTLRGKLTPALADEEITVASLSNGRWKRRTVITDLRGSLKLKLRVRRTTVLVAQWDGDGAARGAGSRAATVLVRP